MFIIEEKIKKFLTIAEIINQKQKEMRDLLNLSTTEINEPISRLNDEIEELKKNLPSFTKEEINFLSFQEKINIMQFNICPCCRHKLQTNYNRELDIWETFCEDCNFYIEKI